jgi:hypothetical protein
VTPAALDNVRRALRVAAEWKRDASIPHGVAEALLEHLEPIPASIEKLKPADIETVCSVANMIVQFTERHVEFRSLQMTKDWDAIKCVAALGRSISFEREHSPTKGPYR